MLKAKQKTVSILLACLTMLAALVFGFVSFFNTPTTTASAATAYVETTFGEGKLLITTTFDGSTYYLPTTASSAPVAEPFTDVSEIGKENLWTVTANGSNYYIQNSEGNYLYTTNTNNGVRIGTTQGTWSYDSSNNSFKYSTITRYLGIYNSQDWRSYNSVTADNYKESSTSFKFYKVNEGGSEEPKEIFDLNYSYPISVTFNGAESTVSVEEGTKITLPDTTAPEGYVFAGWADEAINTPTTTKPTLYTDTYTVTAEKTLYAVYHNDVEAGGWNLVTDTSTLVTGDIVTITAPSKNVAIGAKSGTYFTRVDISIEDNSFADTDSVLKLTLTKNSDNTYSFYTGTEYLAYTGSSNTLNTSGSITKSSSWTLTTSSITNANSTNRMLQYNASSPRFACYTSDQTAVALYKYTEGGEISYTSVFCDHSETYTETEEATCTQDGAIITKCSNCDAEISRETIEATGHQNTTTTTVDATCTENGSITVTCDDCGETVSTETIAATGHSLDEGVTTTEPQVGVEGVKTYTCQNGCGYTETESIPALDATKYTLTYSVPNGVEAPNNEEIAKSGTTTLPSITAPEGFTFLGWASEEYKETKTAPTYLEAGSEYTLEVEENVTFYALFTYSVGSGDFVKVTENRDDWSGEYLIVYEDGTNAYIFNATDANNGYISATIENSVIEFSDDLNAEMVTIAAMSGGYSIKTKNGYIYGNSTSNKLLFNPTTPQLNIIEFNNDGTFLIENNDSPLQFNNSDKRFRYYYKALQKNTYLYALDSATYYATDLSVKIESASITVGDSLTVNYKVSMPAVYADAMMQFTLDGKDTEVKGTLVDSKYVFSLPVPPQAMADNIEAKLYFNDVLLASMAEYSIKTYAQNRLNDSDDITEKRLVSDMLYYGAAAQNYKNYNTANLATDGVANLLAATDEAPAETSKSTNVYNTEITEYPAYIASAGVYFDDVNKIYIRLNTIENVKVYVKIGDGVKTEANLTGTTYYTDGISATGFGTKYVFEVECDGVLMQTLTYSVDAYAYAKKGDTEIGNLALALYRYGKSAEAYKNA